LLWQRAHCWRLALDQSMITETARAGQTEPIVGWISAGERERAVTPGARAPTRRRHLSIESMMFAVMRWNPGLA
jgi:hypothetical protein